MAGFIFSLIFKKLSERAAKYTTTGFANMKG